MLIPAWVGGLRSLPQLSQRWPPTRPSLLGPQQGEPRGSRLSRRTTCDDGDVETNWPTEDEFDPRAEERVRREARRQGLRLRKSRRDGSYCLIDPYDDALIYGDKNNWYGLTLEQVADYLRRQPI